MAWAVIGGSGFECVDDLDLIEELPRKTPFGLCSSGFAKVKLGREEFIFLPRHGKQHQCLPSEINYQANIFALKSQGVTKVIACLAVESLREDIQPGDLVVPSQFINHTRSRPSSSFCKNGAVGHISLARPIWENAARSLSELMEKFHFTIHFDRTYLCIDGPHFSTKAEALTHRKAGADLVGMTAFPEYALAREAGICYLPCCFVTDYDCWDDSIQGVGIHDFLRMMHENKAKAFRVIEAALALDPPEEMACREGGLRTGLVTPWAHIRPEDRQWLEVLMT